MGFKLQSDVCKPLKKRAAQCLRVTVNFRWKDEISFTTVCPRSYPGQVSCTPTERWLHSGYCNTEAPACIVGLFSWLRFVLKGAEKAAGQGGWMDQTQTPWSHHTKHLPSSLKTSHTWEGNLLSFFFFFFLSFFQIIFRCWLITFIPLHSAADWRWFIVVYDVFNKRFLDLLTRKLD